MFIGTDKMIVPAQQAALPLGTARQTLRLKIRDLGLSAMVLVGRYFRPDRPPKPMKLPIDWLAITLIVVWLQH